VERGPLMHPGNISDELIPSPDFLHSTSTPIIFIPVQSTKMTLSSTPALVLINKPKIFAHAHLNMQNGLVTDTEYPFRQRTDLCHIERPSLEDGGNRKGRDLTKISLLMVLQEHDIVTGNPSFHILDHVRQKEQYVLHHRLAKKHSLFIDKIVIAAVATTQKDQHNFTPIREWSHCGCVKGKKRKSMHLMVMSDDLESDQYALH
jgi:hypothetical protein